VPVARSTSRLESERKEQTQSREPGNDVRAEIATDTLLASWTAVFPLSRGPAHRVRLRIGPDVDAELVAAITADYVRELSERVPDGCWIDAGGDLVGAPEFDDAPLDVLFTAVFTTDLDAIVRRNSPPAMAPLYVEHERPAIPSRSKTN
jgi:hypothetical protein